MIPRQELFLRIAARGIADHALILAELRLEEERIFPGEGRRRERLLLHDISWAR